MTVVVLGLVVGTLGGFVAGVVGWSRWRLIGRRRDLALSALGWWIMLQTLFAGGRTLGWFLWVEPGAVPYVVVGIPVAVVGVTVLVGRVHGPSQ